jgi:hypothetical protein
VEVVTGPRDGTGGIVLLPWGLSLAGPLFRAVSTESPVAAVVLGVLSSGEVFGGKSVGVNDGPTMIGSVGRGEGLTSETSEVTDDRYMSLINSVLAGMTLEKEGNTDMWSSVALMVPLEGTGVEDRKDSVKMDVK